MGVVKLEARFKLFNGTLILLVDDGAGNNGPAVDIMLETEEGGELHGVGFFEFPHKEENCHAKAIQLGEVLIDYFGALEEGKGSFNHTYEYHVPSIIKDIRAGNEHMVKRTLNKMKAFDGFLMGYASTEEDFEVSKEELIKCGTYLSSEREAFWHLYSHMSEPEQYDEFEKLAFMNAEEISKTYGDTYAEGRLSADDCYYKVDNGYVFCPF